MPGVRHGWLVHEMTEQVFQAGLPLTWHLTAFTRSGTKCYILAY